MTANFDNSAAVIPGTIRDAATGHVMLLNSDGSIKATSAGMRNTASGTVATQYVWIPGTIRDPVSGTPMTVNSDGSINISNS